MIGIPNGLSDSPRENPRYLSDQLITYIGNKRNLLDFIAEGLTEAMKRLGKDKIDAFDVFAGSGIVSRFLKRYSRTLWSNDLERYAEAIGRCYLTNASDFPAIEFKPLWAEFTRTLEEEPLKSGLIARNYAPADDRNIRPGERVFYTTRNARFIDTARGLIDTVPDRLRPFFLAPLLAEASVHANTAGVFKGFYKNRDTGVGKFGGKAGDALTRITGNIALPYPILSDFECETHVLCAEARAACELVPEVDVAYLDPPYNQHPYGSNYFMLNAILENRIEGTPSRVSGIPSGWKRSDYNRGKRALAALDGLVSAIRAKFILISFNSEGFITKGEMARTLEVYGRVTVFETGYNAFRGSRNLANRDAHVKEFLFLLERD